MKKLNLLTLSLFCCMLAGLAANAQDFIVRKNKLEIKAKVLEVSTDVIKYKKFEMPDGPTYSISKADVAMIEYSNGTKEYMDGNGQKPSSALNAEVENTPATADDEATEKKDNSFLSASVDKTGNSYDVEGWWAFSHKPSTTGKIYIGLSAYSAISATPMSGGLYPFLGYKVPLDAGHYFNIWVNAGYNISYVESYYSGTTYVASTVGSNALWEAGADLFFSDHFGLTGYTSQGNSYWFGIIIR